MSFENILIAVDTSDDADTVIQTALSIANPSTTVHLFTAVEPLSSVYGSIMWAPASADTHDIESTLMNEAAKHLQELGTRHAIAVERIHLELGPPARMIREEAARLEADLIVIGTHARHGLGLLLGSTANSVLHGVGTDVLVVKLPES